ncbi:hypothetical protein LAZ67_3004072 [Cordylochernes scorpioides]|uniref:CCHC-type domain-containing protein n=1 Tax=Cordylochernes scorpioides TaxID=51811 RepID=A0ABY6KAE1_9ARAC|nr:hypothetical protein LAZ67_3004072 [Cordylochernes scorpioides]
MILGKNAQNVQKITDLIKENPRTTLLELEQDTGISKTTIGRIVTKDLMLKKTPAKFIPRFLTNEQKLCRLATCEDMLEMTRTDPEWKDKIITGDETWVYDYDPETKRQYAEWRGQVHVVQAMIIMVVEVGDFFYCVRDVNLAAARDVTLSLPAGTSSNGAVRVLGNWADYTEDQGPGEDDNFTVVKSKKRRRDSPSSPTAATPSSGTRGAGATRRPRSSTGWAPRAEEVRTTRAHIAEARARQASSTEGHCVYVERSPELEPYHYMRAMDRMFGSTREVFQVTKMNGHFLVGLAIRGMAERLVNEGLEVEGTLHRAFPFRKRAERITVGNLPFFVGDAAVISALTPFGRVTSIAPKLMKAGPYIYNDGRREAFIILREGMTIERLPTRLDITIKGEAWPVYLSSGIRCSRCRGQGHRRANCPLLAGRITAPGPATPTSPTSVPPATAPGLPQQPTAQPPPSASSSPTMELSDVPPASRVALHPSAAPRPSPPAPSALPVEDTSPAPPPVTPVPSLRAPGGSVSPQLTKSKPPAQDIEMTAIEESSASSTSSTRKSTRDDLQAYIRKSPTVSFAGTDALGLGREEVLDLLSSKTRAHKRGPLLSPPQSNALAGVINQLLDLRPGSNSNIYKVLHQVKAELKTSPAAVPPTPPLPATRPAEPTPPALHGEWTSPDIATPPPPLSTQFIDACYDQAGDIIYALSRERFSEPLSNIGVTEGDIVEAIIFPVDREPLLRRLSTQKRTTLAEIISAASECARNSDPFDAIATATASQRQNCYRYGFSTPGMLPLRLLNVRIATATASQRHDCYRYGFSTSGLLPLRLLNVRIATATASQRQDCYHYGLTMAGLLALHGFYHGHYGFSKSEL